MTKLSSFWRLLRRIMAAESSIFPRKIRAQLFDIYQQMSNWPCRRHKPHPPAARQFFHLCGFHPNAYSEIIFRHQIMHSDEQPTGTIITVRSDIQASDSCSPNNICRVYLLQREHSPQGAATSLSCTAESQAPSPTPSPQTHLPPNPP